MTRFELAASSSRTKRATGLRYIPNRFALQNYTIFQYNVQNVVEFFFSTTCFMLFEGINTFASQSMSCRLTKEGEHLWTAPFDMTSLQKLITPKCSKRIFNPMRINIIPPIIPADFSYLDPKTLPIFTPKAENAKVVKPMTSTEDQSLT